MVVLAVVAGAALFIGGVANAAPPTGTLGTLTLTPASGSDQTAPQVMTSAGCPMTADSYIVTVNGPNKFDNLVLVSTISSGISHDGPFSTPFGVSMKDAASANNTALVAGEYDVTLTCVDGFTQQGFGTFTTAMNFSDPTHYTASGSAGGPSPSVSPSVSPSPFVSPSVSPSPSTSDSDTTPPSPSTSDIAGASTSADPSGGGNAVVSTGTLANTGAPIGLVFLVGVILLAAGLALVVWRQRPRRAVGTTESVSEGPAHRPPGE